jgi:hypothetical protein
VGKSGFLPGEIPVRIIFIAIEGTVVVLDFIGVYRAISGSMFLKSEHEK